jgi:hypothetical protein
VTPAELLLLASLLAPGAERAGDVRAVTEAIATAVASQRERLYDERTDAAIMLVYAWRESGFRAHAVGDNGRAKGAWQLWLVPDASAFDLGRAARIWYARAVEGKKWWPDCPLKSVSGGGDMGARIAAHRVALARTLLEQRDALNAE